MNCPDVDRLMEYHAGRDRSEALEEHLRTCSECRELLFTIQAVSEAYEQSFEVPEHLIQRVLSGLPQPEASRSGGWRCRAHLGITGALGALTVLGSLILSGTIGLVGGFGALVMAGVGGMVSMVIRVRAEQGPSDGPFGPLVSG